MNLNATPLISVITVVRNGESVIADCIESVIEQNIEDLEYIVVDGASTDDTLTIVRSYGGMVSICISEPDSGLYDAMNKGLRLASGQFIHFLNADDRYFSSDTLSGLLLNLDSEAVCHAQMIYVDNFGKHRVLGEPFNRDRELRASRMPQPVMVVPSHMYEKVGFFNASYRIAADYDMVLRLTREFPTRFIKMPMTVMRYGGVSYQYPRLAFSEAKQVARAHGHGVLTSWLDEQLKLLKWNIRAIWNNFKHDNT